MKKFSTLMIAFLLVFSLLCGAAAEGEGVVFTTKYFTLNLPENWKIETEDLEQNVENAELLGYLYGPAETDIAVNVSISTHNNQEAVAPYAGEQGVEAYKELILKYFEKFSPEYLETVLVGDLPFILVKYTDEEGETILDVNAVVGGEEVEFMVYRADETETYSVTDEDIELFKTVLQSFRPVTE